jgi:hypothetical protein
VHFPESKAYSKTFIAAVNVAKKRSSSVKPFIDACLFHTTTFATSSRFSEGLRLAMSIATHVGSSAISLFLVTAACLHMYYGTPLSGAPGTVLVYFNFNGESDSYFTEEDVCLE